MARGRVPSRRSWHRLLAWWCACVALLAAARAFAAPFAWPAIDPTDLASTRSAKNPEADVEFLFWRTSLHDGYRDVQHTQHARAKIYTERGAADTSLHNLELAPNERIKEIAARVVKLDGTTTELTKSDFIETEHARIGDVRVKRVSFVFPKLAPGDIVEYRWKIHSKRAGVEGWYFCQQKAPVREYEMEVTWEYSRLLPTWFNVPSMSHTSLDERGLRLKASDLDAFVDEPCAPPQLESRGCIRLAYVRLLFSYRDFANTVHEEFERMSQPSSSVRKKAQEIIGDATDEQEKIRRIYEFCRLKLVNTQWSEDPAVRAEREKLAGRRAVAPKQVLERGRGTRYEIEYTFVAMLRAIGLAPRLATASSSAVTLRSHLVPMGFLMQDETLIALRKGNSFTFYSPGAGLFPFGMNDRFLQGTVATVIDPDERLQATIPIAPAEKTGLKRRARMVLDADGTAHGTVEVTLTGHAAVSDRRAAFNRGTDDLNRELITAVQERLPGAEISEIEQLNLRELDGPVTVRYHITIPGYAENVGQRLVFIPSFFMRGIKPVFTAPERRTALFWRSSTIDIDDVEWVLPADFEVEEPSSPRRVAEANGMLRAEYDLGYAASRHTLTFFRRFTFDITSVGQLFKREAYPTFLQLFTKLNASDQHSVVLRRRALPAAASGTPPPRT